ncbi:hypothetical protein GCM10009736_04830 [Actinomadura bangladeshensis]
MLLLVPPMAGKARWAVPSGAVGRPRTACPVALAVPVDKARSVVLPEPADPVPAVGRAFPVGRPGPVVRSFPVEGARPAGLRAVSGRPVGPEGRTRLEWAGCPVGRVALGR